MFTFMPVAPSFRRPLPREGKYKFAVDNIFYNSEGQLIWKFQLENYYKIISFTFALRMHPNAHYLLEQCMNSIGLSYPENGELCMDVCRGKTGELVAFRQSPTSPVLLISEWIIPEKTQFLL
jgi:hypothetical protein